MYLCCSSGATCKSILASLVLIRAHVIPLSCPRNLLMMPCPLALHPYHPSPHFKEGKKNKGKYAAHDALTPGPLSHRLPTVPLWKSLLCLGLRFLPGGSSGSSKLWWECECVIIAIALVDPHLARGSQESAENHKVSITAGRKVGEGKRCTEVKPRTGSFHQFGRN